MLVGWRSQSITPPWSLFLSFPPVRFQVDHFAFLDLDRTVMCPLPRNNENATFHITKATYHPGDTLSYKCNVGFQLIGNNNVLQCERTGKWNPGLTNCQSKSMEPSAEIWSNICVNILGDVGCMKYLFDDQEYMFLVFFHFSFLKMNVWLTEVTKCLSLFFCL